MLLTFFGVEIVRKMVLKCRMLGPKWMLKCQKGSQEKEASGSLHDWLARERIYYQDGLVTSD